MLTQPLEPASLGPHPAALGRPFDPVEKSKFCKQSHLVFSLDPEAVNGCLGSLVSKQVVSELA